MIVAIGRKFARLTTHAVVRRPGLWRVFRPLMRLQFDRLAPVWDANARPARLAPYEAALERVQSVRDALDVGTGTGDGAFAIATRYPDASVVGVDVAAGMLAEAERKLPPQLRDRVRFERADASALPYADASFDLVAHSNMIPFFDEVARVVTRGGYALYSFTSGAETPIYVPFDLLRTELERRGFTDFAEIAVGDGTAFLARKR